MAQFFFFTDPDLLDVQPAAQAFGPAGTAAGEDQFRVTDLHTSSSTGAPAVAVCDGVLCAQEDDQGALTLILKPSETPPFESPVVSYFIYKGIAKASLLNVSDGNILDENATGATDFTKRIAREWKTQNANDLTGSNAALGLDRNDVFLHGDAPNQISIFTDSDPLDRLFSYPHKTVQLPTVSAGEVIGSFENSFGFEVVLKRLGYKPKLEFARGQDNVVSVTSLPADNSGAPWQPDDYPFFTHWHEKEQVLSFLDPAAFFGSFVQAKLYKRSGNVTSRIKGSDVYEDVLAKFANRNIAWLDIRNNYGYSYNLFGLYDDTIRFVSHNDESLTNDVNFRSGLWPILGLHIAGVPGSKRRSLHRTKLCLPVRLSTAPAVLVSKGFVKNLGPERPNFKAPKIAPDSSGQFYTPFRLAFPATDDNGQTVFIAGYTRINIYDKPHVATQPNSSLNIGAAEYLDGIFRLRDLQLDEDFAGNSLRFEIFDEEALIDLDDQGGPTYSASVGVAEDDNYVTLFAYPSFFLPNENDRMQIKSLPGWPNTATPKATGFLSRLSNSFPSVTIKKKTFQPDDLTHDVDLISVTNQSANNLNVLTDVNGIEHFCFVVLNKADYHSLLGQVLTDGNIDPALPVFLTISSSLEKRDTVNNINYIEKMLRVSAYKLSSSAKAQLIHVPLFGGVYQNADL